jgi:CRISPR-associated protein Csx10
MIYIRIRSRQPICVAAEQAQGTIRRTLEYIPGSVLRGALAAHLRTVRSTISQQDFARIILGPGAQFHNLYPLPSGRDVSLPLPGTARSCKLYPGFIPRQPRAGQLPPHGVQDLLFPYLHYRLTPEVEKKDRVLDPYCRHDECGLPLEPFRAFYSGLHARDYVAAEISRRQVTQTAIDPHRETASPANLFTVEALEEDLQFAGHFTLGEGADEADFCTVCREGDTLRLGYGRTRGLGLVEVLDCRAEEPALWADELPERLRAFNKAAKTYRCEVPGYTLFALMLLSDAIVLDPFFRHQATLDGPTLAREIHPDLASAEGLLAFSGTRLVSGWSTPHRLPLPEDQAITAGSVFVFKTPLTEDRLVHILEETDLERRGIGERTAEGFGQVVVCHPFHQEVSPV